MRTSFLLGGVMLLGKAMADSDMVNCLTGALQAPSPSHMAAVEKFRRQGWD